MIFNDVINVLKNIENAHEFDLANYEDEGNSGDIASRMKEDLQNHGKIVMLISNGENCLPAILRYDETRKKLYIRHGKGENSAEPSRLTADPNRLTIEDFICDKEILNRFVFDDEEVINKDNAQELIDNTAELLYDYFSEARELEDWFND